MDDLYTPLLDIVNRKLSITATNCADPFGPLLASPIVANSAALPPPMEPAAPVTTPLYQTPPAVALPKPAVAPPEPAVAPLESQVEPVTAPEQSPPETTTTEATATRTTTRELAISYN